MIRTFGDLSFVTAPKSHASALDELEVTLNFFGDWAPGSGRSEFGLQHALNYLPETLSSYLSRSDINVLNLETTITQDTIVSGGTSRLFREPPSALEFLKRHNFNLASLANNHVMDYLEAGLKETLDHLDTYSLGHAGAGFDRDKIYQPYRFEKNAEKISILCVADGEGGNEKFNKGVGTADVTSFRVIDQIRASKAEGYFTVVFVHAGIEFLPYPAPFIQDIYRNFADQGADLVIGHHPHIIQGMEFYSGVPIFYSVGHFDLYRKSGRADERLGLMVSLGLLDSRISRINLLPFKIEEHAIKLLDDVEFNKFLEMFKERSTRLSDSDFLEKVWGSYVIARQPLLDLRKTVNQFRTDSDMSIQTARTIVSSLNSGFMYKKFQETPTSSDYHRGIIRGHQVLRKQGICERIFLSQKDLFRYPMTVLRKLFKMVKRI